MDDSWREEVFFVLSLQAELKHDSSGSTFRGSAQSCSFCCYLFAFLVKTHRGNEIKMFPPPSNTSFKEVGCTPPLRKYPGKTTSQLRLCRLTVCQINPNLWPAELAFNSDLQDYLDTWSRISIFQGIKWCAFGWTLVEPKWGTTGSHCRKSSDGSIKNKNGSSSRGWSSCYSVNGQK